MKLTALILVLLFMCPMLFADDKDIDFDPSANFSAFKTFLIRNGELTAKAPELRSPLMRKKIEESIRTQLSAKGLSETQGRPDLVVNWRFGAANQQGVTVGPRGRRLATFKFTEGTLVIDLMDREGRDLVWRGIYRDDESNPSKISDKLANDIKKLFQDFPPKKK